MIPLILVILVADILKTQRSPRRAAAQEPFLHECAHTPTDLLQVRVQALIQGVCAEACGCIPLYFEVVLVWEVGHSRKAVEHSERGLLVNISGLLSTSHLERA